MRARDNKNRFLGVSKQEREFYKNYELWLEAYNKKLKIDEKNKSTQLKEKETLEKEEGREQNDELY
ncbi:hypothetical protein [Candidatus Uabimicrobium sp. HlEnr_7]|uniref:hypothetical protein n=1 Tax=Candidatus Uabimicrobium helgolandensis TaxID=3095367 RepID=UPI00355767FA